MRIEELGIEDVKFTDDWKNHIMSVSFTKDAKVESFAMRTFEREEFLNKLREFVAELG